MVRSPVSWVSNYTLAVNAAAAAAAAVKHTNAHTLRTPKHEGLHIHEGSIQRSLRGIVCIHMSSQNGSTALVQARLPGSRLQRLLTEGQVQL